MVLTCWPRKIRAMIATIAMRARISAYSARPWPSSSRRTDAMSALISDMLARPPFPESPRNCAEGGGHLTSRRRGVSMRGRQLVDVGGHNQATRNQEAAGARRRRRRQLLGASRLDRRADLRQDRADLLPEEDEGDDRDDRDE